MQTYATGAAITSLTLPAASDGNTPLAYSLSPTPPDGLVFNAAARTISGAPTAAQNAVTYTYTVTDADGDTDRRTISITVDGTPAFPADAVGAQTYSKGVAITNLTLPVAANGNTPLAYALTPALPDGLVFNSTTRIISGTPTTTQNAAAYTYTATDADGDTDTHSFTITVDGTPSFSADAVAAQTYPRGAAITSLTLPAASDGNTPLTYSLSPAPPDGLVFNAAARTLSGTPTLGQAATTYTYTVTDADGDTATKSFTIAITGDYDLDDDGLIEIDRLAQLDAVRWDLNGDGAVDTGTSVADTAKYGAAYPSPVTGMGCLRDHDDDATTDKIAGCIGYELTQNLDFDTDGDGATYTVSSAGVVTGDAGDAYYNGGKGWKPIGTCIFSGPFMERFTATFGGNGKTISNLFITDTSSDCVGLFGYVGAGGQVERLGVLNLNITGRYYVGGLAGANGGTISASYTSGSITGDRRVGGLVGNNGGSISASYATGSVTGSSARGGYWVGAWVGGLVGSNWGPVNGSYATASVTGTSTVGGLVGRNSGAISANYATGSVTGTGAVGGLVGYNVSGTISANYATGSVTGTTYVGGLVGDNWGPISASYATGSVTGTTNVGSLAGSSSVSVYVISASYATGSVTGTTNVGGLIGKIDETTITNSYWNTETTGQSTSAGGTGKTTNQLQSPTGYAGIYANWNVNLDGVAGNDDPWDFGASSQYPTLKYGGLIPAKQRPITISVQSVNGNIPIVGGPVTATPDLAVSAGITWQWQSSADGATWADIANAASRTYIPVAADAASGGKYLRVKASFTVWGERRTATSDRTAKVVSDSAAPSTAATSVPIVGEKLRYYLSAVGATHRTAWQWRRCDDAAMTTNCVLRSQSNSARDAHTEYTPVAGSDSDVGKYLQAYAYYAANDAGKTWTRAESPVLGPVVAAPATTPTLTP